MLFSWLRVRGLRSPPSFATPAVLALGASSFGCRGLCLLIFLAGWLPYPNPCVAIRLALWVPGVSLQEAGFHNRLHVHPLFYAFSVGACWYLRYVPRMFRVVVGSAGACRPR